MADIPIEGSIARPVSLDPFQRIVEVNWGSAPILVMNIDGGFGYYITFAIDPTADPNFADPPASIGVISKDAYRRFSKYDPDFNFSLGLVLDSETNWEINSGGGRTITETYKQYFNVVRRAVMY